jgi:hypothetical protein
MLGISSNEHFRAIKFIKPSRLYGSKRCIDDHYEIKFYIFKLTRNYF